MAFTNAWDVTQPPDSQLANQLGLDLRNLRVDTQQRMASISGLDAAKPNFAGDAQPGNWNGVLFFATDTGKIYKFVNPAWVDTTNNFLLNNIKKYVNIGTGVILAPSTVTLVTIPLGTVAAGNHVRIVWDAGNQGGAAASFFISFAGIQVSNTVVCTGSGGGGVHEGGLIELIAISNTVLSYFFTGTTVVTGVLSPSVLCGGIIVPDMSVNAIVIAVVIAGVGGGIEFNAVAEVF
jgi:hypothetical protein